jgi:CIC family chloride channel protein
MASFIAAAYKTPLAAVVFVAEATGGHAFIIPALIGSAVAYAISGDASVSADQLLHEQTAERAAEKENSHLLAEAAACPSISSVRSPA